LKIVVDQNIRGAEETFGRHADLVFKDGREICAGDLSDADALVVRTATQVNRKLLQFSPVRFVGTTSIGIDHLDTGWLDQQGIRWANAPGCNADAAAQYTLAMIWLACQRMGRALNTLSVGIIGRGNVGSRLDRLLRAFGVKTLANDPPLAEQGESGLVSLEEVLSQDIVSLHVPLTEAGAHPTQRLIGAGQLSLMPDGALLVNAARGDVVDGAALVRELRSRRLFAALDTWPGEPLIDHQLLEAAVVATPHVAGYSNDGKRNGTYIVYRAFCRHTGLPAPDLPKPPGPLPHLSVKAEDDCISRALDAACFVRRHDTEMKSLLGRDIRQRASEFDRLRRDYPPRRDFQAWSVDCRDAASARLLGLLGFVASTTE